MQTFDGSKLGMLNSRSEIDVSNMGMFNSTSDMAMVAGEQGRGAVSPEIASPAGISGKVFNFNLKSGIAVESDIGDNSEGMRVSGSENRCGNRTECEMQGLVVHDSSPEDLDPLLQLAPEDVDDEITCWQQAVMCFIIGANPPWSIIEGFVRRIWSQYQIDKISFMKKGVFLVRFKTMEMMEQEGVFLVRFKTMEMMEQVLQSGYYLFDNKPLIVRPWSKDGDMKKEAIQTMPAWIQLHSLPLKCWGKGLPKIANLVGKYVKKDAATEGKTHLGFARVMVKLQLDQKFLELIVFKDERGVIVTVQVVYEWKPISCLNCKGIGHDSLNCRKKVVKAPSKVWQPVLKDYGKDIRDAARVGSQTLKDVLKNPKKGRPGSHNFRNSNGPKGTVVNGTVLDESQFPILGKGATTRPDLLTRGKDRWSVAAVRSRQDCRNFGSLYGPGLKSKDKYNATRKFKAAGISCVIGSAATDLDESQFPTLDSATSRPEKEQRVCKTRVGIGTAAA